MTSGYLPLLPHFTPSLLFLSSLSLPSSLHPVIPLFSFPLPIKASPQLNGGGPICVSIATSSLTGAEKDVVRKTAALLQAEVTNDVSQQSMGHCTSGQHDAGMKCYLYMVLDV